MALNRHRGLQQWVKAAFIAGENGIVSPGKAARFSLSGCTPNGRPQHDAIWQSSRFHQSMLHHSRPHRASGCRWRNDEPLLVQSSPRLCRTREAAGASLETRPPISAWPSYAANGSSFSPLRWAETSCRRWLEPARCRHLSTAEALCRL